MPRNRSKEGPVDESLDQEDPILINIIQQKYLERPPPPGPLKLTMVKNGFLFFSFFLAVLILIVLPLPCQFYPGHEPVPPHVEWSVRAGQQDGDVLQGHGAGLLPGVRGC